MMLGVLMPKVTRNFSTSQVGNLFRCVTENVEFDAKKMSIVILILLGDLAPKLILRVYFRHADQAVLL